MEAQQGQVTQGQAAGGAPVQAPSAPQTPLAAVAGLAHGGPGREVFKSSEVRHAREGRQIVSTSTSERSTSRLTERQTHFDIKIFYSDPIQI